MKCSRCFKLLPETEWYTWISDDRGSCEGHYPHKHPWYTCLTCNKVYCISCWVKKSCKDMVYI